MKEPDRTHPNCRCGYIVLHAKPIVIHPKRIEDSYSRHRRKNKAREASLKKLIEKHIDTKVGIKYGKLIMKIYKRSIRSASYMGFYNGQKKKGGEL